MKRLLVLGLLLAFAACAQQPPPPAATAPPPQVAATPPPPPAPPPPPSQISFDGRYAGTAVLGVSGVQSFSTTNPICVNHRPIDMTIHNGNVTISYHNWKRSKLHYRGHIDPNGSIYTTHLNGDGTRSEFRMQVSDAGASGQLQRGNCWYDVQMTRA